MTATYRQDEPRLLRRRVEELEAQVEVLEGSQDERATRRVRVELDRRDARIEELEEERERMVGRLASAHVENERLRKELALAEEVARPGETRRGVARRGAAGRAIGVLGMGVGVASIVGGLLLPPLAVSVFGIILGLLGLASGFALTVDFWSDGR